MQFKFLNIPVTIERTFCLFLFFFCYQSGLEMTEISILALVMFFSLLFHEYGHALAAKKFGQHPEITLEAFGGYAAYDGRRISEKHHFIITLCGPLFTALLIGVSFLLLKNHEAYSYPFKFFLHYTQKLNTYWLIVNLAPLYPMDGGKLVGYFFKRWLGNEKGHLLSLMLGNIVAVAGATYFLLNESYIFAYLFLYHGWKNFQLFRLERRERKPIAFVLYNQAVQELAEKNTEKSGTLFKKLVKSKDPYIKARAIEGLAEVLILEGKKSEAYRLLLSTNLKSLSRGKWLLCQLAYDEKNYSLFNELGREAYEANPTFETALLNAKAFSQLQDPFYGAGWLNTALHFQEATNQSLAVLVEDVAFDPIRSSSEFQELCASTMHH